MNIINIGGWYVGNTAILDWMDGFEELAVVRGDLNIAREENGIMDIIAESNVAKKLFMIRQKKIDCFYGSCRVYKTLFGLYTKNLFKSKIEYGLATSHLKFYRILIEYLNQIEIQIQNYNQFDEIDFWKKWIAILPTLENSNKNYINAVYQNPFFYDETFNGHNSIWPKLFTPYKLIFVHRDPLDQFTDIVNNGDHLGASFPRFHGGTDDLHPADRFLAISSKIYKARLRMAQEYSKDELLIFSFEDFLNEHERVTDALKIFLNIKSHRDSTNKRFLKEHSIQNIGKGKYSEEVKSLLKNKPYVINHINELREQLRNHPNSIP